MKLEIQFVIVRIVNCVFLQLIYRDQYNLSRRMAFMMVRFQRRYATYCTHCHRIVVDQCSVSLIDFDRIVSTFVDDSENEKGQKSGEEKTEMHKGNA